MQTKKIFGTEEYVEDSAFDPSEQSSGGVRKKQSLGMRILTAALDGGKSGVDIGLSIIPGVLVICTIVMMLTKGAPEGGVYTGAAYEGISLLPRAANAIKFILQPLFGFSSTHYGARFRRRSNRNRQRACGSGFGHGT